MPTDQAEVPFGPWRAALWPVYHHELGKVGTLFAMFMLINFNYTLLRNTKDTLVVLAAGAEIIPFLKVWCVLPAAIAYMLLYSRASDVMGKTALFRASIAPFVIYFTLFGFYIYPNREALHPTATCAYLTSVLPTALHPFVNILRYWSYSLFYVLSELWGSFVLSVLFWGATNDCVEVKQAKRLYTLLGVGANFALLFAGPFIGFLTGVAADKGLADPWAVSLRYLCFFVVMSSLGIVVLHSHLVKNYSPDSSGKLSKEQNGVASPKKMKMGLMESIRFLVQDEYIMCLAALVVTYGISINLVEVTWKNQLKQHFTTPADYVNFMGYFSSATGAVTLFMMLFVGGNMIRTKGWGFTARFTPYVLLVTGVIFFALVIFTEKFAQGSESLLIAAIYVGAAQNILTKSSKYSLFDPTKEMAYIPLEKERKVKGKAAIDGVGSRLGKSGGSLAQQMMLVICGHLSRITTMAGVLLVVTIIVWISSVRRIEPMFEELTAKQEGRLPQHTTSAKQSRLNSQPLLSRMQLTIVGSLLLVLSVSCRYF